MKRFLSLSIALIGIIAFVGVSDASPLIKSVHSKKYAVVDYALVSRGTEAIVIIGEDFHLTCRAHGLKMNEYAVMPSQYVFVWREPYNDPYLHRSQAWIRATNLQAQTWLLPSRLRIGYDQRLC